MTANQPTQTPSDIREAQVNPRELDRARNLICTKLIDGMQIGEYMF